MPKPRRRERLCGRNENGGLVRSRSAEEIAEIVAFKQRRDDNTHSEMKKRCQSEGAVRQELVLFRDVMMQQIHLMRGLERLVLLSSWMADLKRHRAFTLPCALVPCACGGVKGTPQNARAQNNFDAKTGKSEQLERV